ncbi:MAG: PEP-CTERM sorting domain-containing protein [Phycisphaerae bacterium]|nr:PEP-CTERM sorting domain-containing protein [Phycisphaerae bacterium]
MCHTKRAMGIGLIVAVLACANVQAAWEDEKADIMAAEMLLTRVYYDALTLSDFGYGEGSFDFSLAISTDSFAYECAAGSSYGGESLVLSGVGQRSGDQWSGTTTGSLGETALNMPWVSNIEWLESGANCDWHTGIRWEPDSSWTVESSPGGGFAVSTHANGGTDRGVLHAGPPRRWVWTLTQTVMATTPPINIAMSTPGDGPGVGSANMEIVPEPASAGLLALGLLLTRGLRRQG